MILGCCISFLFFVFIPFVCDMGDVIGFQLRDQQTHRKQHSLSPPQIGQNLYQALWNNKKIILANFSKYSIQDQLGNFFKTLLIWTFLPRLIDLWNKVFSYPLLALGFLHQTVWPNNYIFIRLTVHSFIYQRVKDPLTILELWLDESDEVENKIRWRTQEIFWSFISIFIWIIKIINSRQSWR